MGCDHYVGGIMFSEGDDEVGCLCTFPHNDGDRLDVERVRSLAYLGAAVVLQKRGDLEHPYLPGCLPAWIRDEIDRNLHLTKASSKACACWDDDPVVGPMIHEAYDRPTT